MGAKVLEFPRRSPLTVQEVAALARADVRAAVKDGRLPGSWRDYSVTCRPRQVVPVVSFRVKGWTQERAHRLRRIASVSSRERLTDEAVRVTDLLMRLGYANSHRACGYHCEIWFDFGDRTSESSRP